MDQPEILKPTTTESPFARSPTPKLSIIHLLLWTFCSAIYLTLSRTLVEIQHQEPNDYVSLRRWMDVLQGGLSGAVFAGAMILVYSRVRHPTSLRLYPGHWLLLIDAASTTINFPVMFLVAQMAPHGLGTKVLILYSLLSFFSGVANALAGYRSESLRWKLTFGVMGLLNIFHGGSLLLVGLVNNFHFLLGDFNLWCRLLLSVCVVVVSIFDLRGQQRLDWLHWTGITTYVASACPIVMVMIWIRFFQS